MMAFSNGWTSRNALTLASVLIPPASLVRVEAGSDQGQGEVAAMTAASLNRVSVTFAVNISR
jgi:hypothetical protein